MRRLACAPAVGLALLVIGSGGPAIGLEVRATLERVDAEAGLVVFKAPDGRQRSVRVEPGARVVDRADRPLEGGLRSSLLKAGEVVVLTVEPRDGRPLIRAIKLGAGPALAQAKAKGQAPALPPQDTSALKALSDMGPGETYHGAPGGLYPGSSNQRPAAHEAAGLQLARAIRPLDAEGKPSDDGKIVVLGVGFSNTVQCFNGFMKRAEGDAVINPHVVLVDGAHGGRSAFMIQSPDANEIGRHYWRTWIPDHLRARGVTAAQVQAVWLKETDANLGPGMLRQLGVSEYHSPLREPFPESARILQRELAKIVQVIHRLYPNVKLVYLSSRSYGGWAVREGNREPFSYETGYAVKWLIEDQISGDPTLNYDPARGEVKAPWLSWGPYLWANGQNKRRDGFAFEPTDYRDDDHMHHSEQGMLKMGGLLLDFFKTDPTTRGWFVKPGR